jgi:hypothetical protein
MRPAELNVRRYETTDAIDDLRGDRSLSEVMAIGAMLHPRLVELALRGRRRWNGTGKWAPRLLPAVDAGLAASFDHAFREFDLDISADTLFAPGSESGHYIARSPGAPFSIAKMARR